MLVKLLLRPVHSTDLPLDLNLLVALDHLLREGSVAGAAQRMNLSSPAMSRTLARIRDALGDPILVRAGRGLVPTPRAEKLRERVRALVAEAQALFRDQETLDPALDRTFTVRAADVGAAFWAGPLLALVHTRLPTARLRFVPEGDEDADMLRDGQVDLDVGVNDDSAPELIRQVLGRARFFGFAREGHPLLARPITPKRFAACEHVSVSRRGRLHGPLDRALHELGLTRRVSLVVGSYLAALRIVASSDLVGAGAFFGEVPGVRTFPLPVPTPVSALTQTWHPRMENDPAHRWLRTCVKRVCR
jgi:DNA-binding transcriptional LysR family regulator